MCLAKALYDNKAESPDELDFLRGDIVTVLEQDTSGLEGWWLCTLRGKRGIAPGNRLKMLAGAQDAIYQSPANLHNNRKSWHQQEKVRGIYAHFVINFLDYGN